MTAKHPQRSTLRDGSAVDVRRLDRADRAGLEAATGRLSHESRYQRSTPPPRMSDRELDRLLDIDHHEREALLAVDPLARRGISRRSPRSVTV